MIIQDVAVAQEALEKGQLVGLPTETVYGLAANAFDPLAVARIFEAKQRPSFDPLIVHIGHLSQLDELATDLPLGAKLLAKKFWPGPLTLVLPRTQKVPDIVTAGLPTVAIRMPAHPLALKLLQSLPFPLAAPSANPFGYVSPTTAQHVHDQLAEQVACILDGGACSVGVESTIVGFPDGQPTILRLGGVPVEAIEFTLGIPNIPAQLSSSQPHAPGQLVSHYATKRRIGILAHGSKPAHIASSEWIPFFSDAAYSMQSLSLDGSIESAAARLFSVLRRLDDDPKGPIMWIEAAPDKGLGRAINDRLQRAAHRA